MECAQEHFVGSAGSFGREDWFVSKRSRNGRTPPDLGGGAAPLWGNAIAEAGPVHGRGRQAISQRDERRRRGQEAGIRHGKEDRLKELTGTVSLADTA